MDTLQIYTIKTKSKLFISADPNNNSGYNNPSNLNDYYFNGEKAKKSFHASWLYLEEEIKQITKKQSGKQINQRYELIDKSLASEKIPLILTKDEATKCDSSTDYELEWKEPYKIYSSLYEYKWDYEPEKFVEVPFNIILLYDLDYDISEPKEINYKAIHKSSYSNSNYEIKNEDVIHQLADRIFFPSLMIHEKPCLLTSKQTYDIVRRFIKDNINPAVAKITSDYDFCFTVKKRIPISKPYSVQYDGRSLFSKSRKPKMMTRHVSETEVEIFEMTHENDKYKGYTPIEGFEGKNEDDLKDKLDSYLTELITFINEPLKECEHCGGRGVIFNEKFKKDVE